MTLPSGLTGELDRASPGAPNVPVADRGLSSAEAALRLRRYGPNELPRARRVPVWSLIASQLRDPLILVLLAAAVLTLATGDWTDASVILFVIVVNTTVGVVQEVKAERAIAALSELTGPDARVLRDGEQRQIPAAAVVVGDVLLLGEGDIVPADARLVEAAALLVDESALTGESVPVDKTPEGVAGEDDVVSAGTVVTRGRGRAVVTATGAASAMGRIAALVGERHGLTPLQRRLVGIGRALAVAAVALCAIVLAVGLVKGQPVELMVITAISLVVAAPDQAAAGGRDSGLGDGPGHRQDRHVDRRQHGRSAAVDQRRRCRDQRIGVWPGRRRDPAGQARVLR